MASEAASFDDFGSLFPGVLSLPFEDSLDSAFVDFVSLGDDDLSPAVCAGERFVASSDGFEALGLSLDSPGFDAPDFFSDFFPDVEGSLSLPKCFCHTSSSFAP